MLGPTLIGKTVTLEPVQLDDLELFPAWRSDLKVVGLYDPLRTRSLAQEREAYDRLVGKDDVLFWAIKVEDRTIGTTNVHDIDWQNQHASGALLIGDRNSWGRGYAREAVRLRTAFCFEELNLQRLESRSVIDNVAMHRTLERAGYRKIGMAHRVLWRFNRWHDEYIFELLAEEWER